MRKHNFSKKGGYKIKKYRVFILDIIIKLHII